MQNEDEYGTETDTSAINRKLVCIVWPAVCMSTLYNIYMFSPFSSSFVINGIFQVSTNILNIRDDGYI